MQSTQPPKSATNLYINFTALLTSLLTLWWLISSFGAGIAPQQGIFLLAAAYAIPIIALEIIWREPDNTAQQPAAAWFTDYPHTLEKLLGLAFTAALLIGLYWLLPEYRGSFYDRYYAALASLAPWAATLAVPYFFWCDYRNPGERDGYWHMGQLVLLRAGRVDRNILAQHLLGWMVKFFFLPLMFIYFSDKLDFYRSYDFSLIFTNFKTFFDFTLNGLFYIDLLIAFVGYVCAFRITDSHIRSTESTLLGWMVALICYQPFWSFVSAQYMDYGGGKEWGNWLWDYPLLYTAWGSVILVLIAIYAWATLCFGIRFSNLTHRGILTNGPYKYCKHPAYISKNLSWWMISMPFMINVSAANSLRLSFLLLLLNGIYFLRARTEERHLSQDPDYCAYARYIEAHGLFRRLGDAVPALKFKSGYLFNLQSGIASERFQETNP